MCESKLPLYRYSRSSAVKSGVRGDCKDCQKRSKVLWGSNNKYDPVYEKDRKLKRVYGISLNDYNKIFKDQQGKCPICLKALDNGKNTHVDHCHNKGHVRGLLCGHCNRALGNMYDKKESIQRMLRYLIENEEAE